MATNVGQPFLAAAVFQTALKKRESRLKGVCRRACLPHITLAVLLLALTASSCKGRHGRLDVHNDEEPAPMASFVRMNDASRSAQLLSGFYVTEAGAWRWTSGKFAAVLAVPVTASQNGATLTFNLTIPDVVKQHLGKVTLTASINGKVLNSTTYDAAGPAVFTADVPADLLAAPEVKVEFSLDKDLAPNSVGDSRELGVVAHSVGLAGK